MNKNKKDYSKGKIYCIRSHKTDLIYVGSTCQPLSKRLNMHKTTYKAYLKTGISKEYSYKIYELDDAPYIELIVNFPCSCLDELRREEGKHIRLMECINKYVAGRTKKEWCEDNKEHLKEYHKEYYEDNKDQILKQKKEYREHNKDKINQKITCPCGGKYTKQNKAQHEKTNKHKKFINLL